MTGRPRSTAKQSLSDILGDKPDEKETKKVDASLASDNSNKESDKKDPAVNEPVDPVTLDDVQESIKSGNNKGPSPEEEDDSLDAPGDGIISEDYSDDDDDNVTHRREVALSNEGVLGRVHKMNPTGMTVLNTYSGGNDRVDHDELDVVVKPLSDIVTKRERKIVDETGKSRLLHPDITQPNVPSEQAIVYKTEVSEHVYATPYDPENDPNNRR